MGLWGAAQAIAFGMGGLLGTLASDLARLFLGSPTTAYAVVFMGEAVLFLVSAILAARTAAALSGGAQPGRADMAVAFAAPLTET